MQPYLTELYGNPSSIHRFGAQVAEKISEARAQVAALIGAADPIEIIFTSCGTEGDNAAIRGMLEARPDKRHIVTTQVEHPAVLGLCQHLEKRGYRVTWLSVNQEGMLDLEELRNALTDDTALVSVMVANNETGVIFPIDKIGEIVKARGIPFHVDAVQAAGKIPLKVKDSPVDLLTISGSQVSRAPRGLAPCMCVAALRFRLLSSVGTRRSNRRAGTENVAGIVGMGEAAELGTAESGGAVRADSQHCVIGWKRNCFDPVPIAGLMAAQANGYRILRISVLDTWKGSRSWFFWINLEFAPRQVRLAPRALRSPPTCLRAMGVAPDWLQGAVRFSLSRFNTAEEVSYVNEKVPLIVQRLQGLSALGKLGGPATGSAREAQGGQRHRGQGVTLWALCRFLDGSTMDYALLFTFRSKIRSDAAR